MLSGCLAGAAFLFKFPSAIISLFIAGVVALRSCDDAGERHWLRMPGSLALFAGGFAGVSGACAGYFILRGGWSEMLDMLYGFNRYYVLQKPTDAAVALAWVSNFWITNCSPWVCVVLVLWFAGIVFAVKRRYWPIARGAAMAMLLCVSAAASVADTAEVLLLSLGGDGSLYDGVCRLWCSGVHAVSAPDYDRDGPGHCAHWFFLSAAMVCQQ